MVNLSGIDTITPTEYSRYRYFDIMLDKIIPEVRSAADVGCGTGNLPLVLGHHNIFSKAIDSSEESVKLAKAKLNGSGIVVEKKDLFDLEERFDLVFLSEVLEHMKDDKNALRHLHEKVVRPGGYIIITVPAHKCLYSRFDKSVGHFRRYGKRQLGSLLAGTGFSPMLFWSYGSVMFHIIANLSGGAKGGEGLSGNKERTDKSAIRQFSPLMRVFVSRVNVIHRLFFILDRLFRNFDAGIEYCVLCKAA